MAKSGPQSPYGYSPSAWRMIGRGMEVGLVIGGLTYVGYLGDERFDTEPWLMLSGALMATFGGCYNLAKDMMFSPKSKTPPPDSSSGSTQDDSQERPGDDSGSE